MKPGLSHPFFGLFIALVVFGALLLTGCADTMLGIEDPVAERPGVRDRTPKFRHTHLLDRALKPRPGKSASDPALGLIVGFQGSLEKQRVLERYRTTNRYKVHHRYDYDYVFPGLAWTIEDNTGAADFQDFLDSLALDPDVLWFEPAFEVVLPPSNTLPGGGGQLVPWSVAAVGGLTSWAVSGTGTGNVNVDLYILDTGVANADTNDPDDDLALVASIDFRDSMNDAADYDGHGTHIAGIAAAVDDHDGLVGLAPGARVHNLKVLDDDGMGDVSMVIAAVEHILAEKLAHPATPMVVNLSLGEDVGTAKYTALDEAVEAAVAAGIVVVAAAGNYGKDASEITPAHVEGVITVGSFDLEGRFSAFSNRGPMVDLLAPGEGIVSLGSSASGAGSAVMMSGTSMAAAHVSGAALLYLGQHPTASPAQVRGALLEAAEAFVTNTPDGTTNKSVWVGEEPMSAEDDATVLFVVPGADALSDQDATKKALFESWGFTVDLIAAAEPQAAFDAAAGAAGAAYISEEVLSSQLNDKLKDAPIGVVNEEKMLTDVYGFSSRKADFTAAAITINDNTHYCTAPFDTGMLTILSAPSALHTATGMSALGAQVLAQQPGRLRAALVVIDAGGALYGGGTAAGRRVHLPWGNNAFDVHLLNANGELLMRRALEWAAGLDG